MADDVIREQTRKAHRLAAAIGAGEILARARQLSLDPELIERDYVCGWLLAAIAAHPDLRQAWIFRGGTCARKCYGAGSRFSGELLFAVPAEAALQAELLLPPLREIASWVRERAGIELFIPPFASTRDDQFGLCCDVRLAYRGPMPRSADIPEIRLHLTAGEIEILPPVARPIGHPYSDGLSDGLIRCCAIEELISESLFRLTLLPSPAELYDLVALLRHAEPQMRPATVFNAVRRKWTYRRISFPSLARLDPKLKAMSGEWEALLLPQIAEIPRFEQFCAEVTEFFARLEQVAPPHHGICLRADAPEQEMEGRQLFFYECPACGKRSRRFQRDAHLYAHKAPDGTPCPGRRGYFIEAASPERHRQAGQQGN